MKNYNNKKNFKFLILLFITTIIWSPTLYSFDSESTPIDSGWQYRWGDSPFVNGTPLWTSENNDSAWKDIGFPSNPPDRKGQNNIWYKVKLPDQSCSGSSIYIFSIDLIAECYLGSELIYNYGKFKQDGTGNFEGWPWHCFPLPNDYYGKTIYFRIYSDYPDIGLWGEVSLGSEGAHLKNIIKSDLLRISIGSAFLFIGLVLVLFSLIRRNRILFMMGILMLNLGFIPFDSSEIKQLIWFNPLAWQFAGAANYFILPITTAALIHSLYGYGKWRIHQWVWSVHILFLIYAMLFSYQGWVNLSSTYIHYDTLAFFTLLIQATFLFFEARKKDLNRKVLAVGFFVMYIIFVYNGMIAHDFITYEKSSEFIGPAIISLCFGVIIMNKVNTLNKDLQISLKNEITLRQEANASSEAKSVFLATVSHEIRTPLNGVIAMTDLVLDSKLDDEQQDTLETIKESGEALMRIINDILDFSKIDANKLELKYNPFNLEDCAKTVLKPITYNLKNTPVKVSYKYDQELPKRFSGDVGRIHQILGNLLSNAAKFTENGTIELHISRVNKNIPYSESPTILDKSIAIRFEIRDSGIGVKPELINKLFKEFSQVDDSTTRKYGGSGLGLAICKELVELMNGTIGVSSEFGKGSTFWFNITLKEDLCIEPKKMNSSQAQGLSNNQVLKSDIPQSDNDTHKEVIKILVVEDNFINQKVIKKLLKKLGYHFELAKNGQEACEMYESNSKAFGLVLMDIQMPIMGGFEATVRLRKNQDGQDVPIIALTANALSADILKYKEYTMNDLIPKPIQINKLKDTLSHWGHNLSRTTLTDS